MQEQLEKTKRSPILGAVSDQEAAELCRTLREELIRDVSQTGGHLASNLGAVELTVALHRVLDTSRDRLVFDVGHQCYLHKMLTGRREQMTTLRQFGGIAGFPKPNESVHDAFIAGHASNSVAVALGMAQARDQLGEDYTVAALIGDGALTGGLAYEGLSNGGQYRGQLLVILNDNGMSIAQNVGAVAQHLASQRLKPQYLSFKQGYRKVMGSFWLGRKLYRVTHSVKKALKQSLLLGQIGGLFGMPEVLHPGGEGRHFFCKVLLFGNAVGKLAARGAAGAFLFFLRLPVEGLQKIFQRRVAGGKTQGVFQIRLTAANIALFGQRGGFAEEVFGILRLGQRKEGAFSGKSLVKRGIGGTAGVVFLRNAQFQTLAFALSLFHAGGIVKTGVQSFKPVAVVGNGSVRGLENVAQRRAERLDFFPVLRDFRLSALQRGFGGKAVFHGGKGFPDGFRGEILAQSQRGKAFGPLRPRIGKTGVGFL